MILDLCSLPLNRYTAFLTDPYPTSQILQTSIRPRIEREPSSFIACCAYSATTSFTTRAVGIPGMSSFNNGIPPITAPWPKADVCGASVTDPTIIFADGPI